MGIPDIEEEGGKTYRSGNGQLPVVKGKMHNSFCVSTELTTPSVGRQAIEYAFTNLLPIFSTRSILG